MTRTCRRWETTLFLSLLVLSTIFVTTQLADAKTSSQSSSKKRVELLLGTGNSGGAFYYLGAALCQIINKYSTRMHITPQQTAGSGENDRLVNEKSVEFALGSSTTEVLSSQGLGPYKGTPLTNIRGLAGGYIQPVHFTVKADSQINKLVDFRDKKIGMPAGVITTTIAQAILREYGLEPRKDYTPINMGYSGQVDAIKNGTIDGGVQGTAIPVPAVLEMDTTFGIKLISIDNENVIKKINKELGTVAFTIPKGTYPKFNKDVRTVGFAADLIVNKDVPNDIVYEFLTILYKHHDEWVKDYAAAKGFTYKNAMLPGWIKLHPAAIKYFKEKGVLK